MLYYRIKTGLSTTFLVLFFFLFFVPAAPVIAVDYYVDISNPGALDDPASPYGLSPLTPWRTLHFAVSQLLAGDILHVLPGTYSLGQGETDAPLTITNNDVQIRGDSSGGVILDGFNTVSWEAGLTVGTITTGVIIENLEIHTFTEGIILEQNAGATIQGCNIHNNIEGIQVNSSSPRIEKNMITDNSDGVSISSSFSGNASPEILDNVFRDNNIGIDILASSSDSSPTITNNLIYEFVSNAMTYGIRIQGFPSMSTSSSEILHNTIDGGSGDGIYLNTDTDPLSPSIRFNNITDFGGYGISDNGALDSSPTISYNNVHNNTSGNYSTTNLTSLATADIHLPPQYVDSAGQDYHLQSTSPCVNAIPATAGDPVVYDLDGIDRTLPAMGDKDIGCYEFVSTPVSYTFSISINGSGSVSGTGIACPGDCSESVSADTTVSVTATSNPGYAFDRWEEEDGTVHTNNPSSFSMNSDLTVTAFFVPTAGAFTLTVSILPPGSGSVTDTDINCPGDCSETAFSGSIFNLLAAPNSGFVFDRWEEGEILKTDNPNTISLEKNTRVSAIFVSEVDASNAPPEAPASLAPSDGDAFPDGTGSITLQTSAFSDPDDDSHAYTRWLVKRADRNLYFNLDYDSSFDYTATASPDLTQHTVSGLASGMAYFWKAGYADSKGKISWSKEYRFLIGDDSPIPMMQIPPGKTEREYRMISFPIWTAESLCALLFDTSGGYDIRLARAGTWDALSGSYLECDDGLKVKPGRAYWILARNGLNAEPSGIPVTEILDVEVELQQGWNMIACPNERVYTWLDVEVLEVDLSGGTVSGPQRIGELPDTTVIDPTLWRWENGAYAGDTTVMIPYEGYWVRANRENLFLKFPDSAVRASSRHSSEIRGIQGIKNAASNLSMRKAANAKDTPPLPMGIGGDTEKGGCFISVFADCL